MAIAIVQGADSFAVAQQLNLAFGSNNVVNNLLVYCGTTGGQNPTRTWTDSNNTVISDIEFDQYVMDEWGWKAEFTASNALYSQS